jgi:antibiotic biosynthesis monooxygenase (ABM) superfamily enzyme
MQLLAQGSFTKFSPHEINTLYSCINKFNSRDNNMGWEHIRNNKKIPAQVGVHYSQRAQSKEWFTKKICSTYLHQWKYATLQWLQ